MNTSFKRVFTTASTALCKAITSYVKGSPDTKPTFEECVEICFQKEHTTSKTVLTKEGAQKLYDNLKAILEKMTLHTFLVTNHNLTPEQASSFIRDLKCEVQEGEIPEYLLRNHNIPSYYACELFEEF